MKISKKEQARCLFSNLSALRTGDASWEQFPGYPWPFLVQPARKNGVPFAIAYCNEPFLTTVLIVEEGEIITEICGGKLCPPSQHYFYPEVLRITVYNSLARFYRTVVIDEVIAEVGIAAHIVVKKPRPQLVRA